MDKDPEDVNYNFVRWLNNDIGMAIGPSRVHPLTGQILDADIILTDGWIRHYQKQFAESLPDVAMEGFVTARFMIDGLRRAGPALTREKFIAGLKSGAPVTVGDYAVRMTALDRSGGDFVELTVVDRYGRLIR